ncbi:MAG: T9SS type A sorting domain-containing protein [Luteibaculum sp.]
MYNVYKIFHPRYNVGAVNRVTDYYEQALKDFIGKARRNGIKIGIVFQKDEEEIEDFQNAFKSANSNKVVTPNSVKVSKNEILEVLADDTSLVLMPVVRELMDNTPNAEISVNHDLYTLSRIIRFNSEIIETISPDTDIEGTPASSQSNRKSLSGIYSIVTEYEWWNEGERVSDRIGIFDRNDTSTTLFEHHVEFLTLLSAFSGKRFSYDSTRNARMALHQYQGPFPTFSIVHRNLQNPGAETDQDYYNDLNDTSATDRTVYWPNWIAQITYFCDRIMLTNYYPNNVQDIYDSPQMKMMLPEFLGASKDMFENPPFDPSSGGRFDPWKTEFSVMYSAESNDFVNAGGIHRHKADLFGKLLSKGGTNGESIYKLEQRFKDLWVGAWNLNGETSFERNYSSFKGSTWFSYSLMPNMVYSMENRFDNKKQLSNINKYGLNGVRYDYFPNLSGFNATDSIYLQVYNLERDISSTNANQVGNINRIQNAGNTYSWKVHQNGIYNYATESFNIPSSFGSSSPVVKIREANRKRGWYTVETTDERGCVTSSLPVQVQFHDYDVYIRDYNDDDGESATDRSGNFWETPDIIVNQSQFDRTNHVPIRTGDNITNYIHLNIWNKSNEIIPKNTVRLELYFAQASTGHAWPNSWVLDKTVVNGDTLLIGDRINLGPLYIDQDIPASNGISDGKVELDIPWLGKYLPQEVLLQGNSLDESRHYCLLVRIIRSENLPNYGMKVQELADVGDNITKNNAIAMKNLTVLRKDGSLTTNGNTEPIANLDSLNVSTDFNSNTDIKEERSKLEWNTATQLVGNMKENGNFQSLVFRLPQEDELSAGATVKIDLGPELFKKWQSSGFQGGGIRMSPINDFRITQDLISGSPDDLLNEIPMLTTIEVLEDSAWIGDLWFEAKEKVATTIGIKFDSLILSKGQYRLEMKQYEEIKKQADKLVGGQTFVIDNSPCAIPYISSASVSNGTSLLAQIPSNEFAIRYQWYKNDLIINGATEPILDPDGDGKYTVFVEYSTGCTNISEPYIFPSPLQSNRKDYNTHATVSSTATYPGLGKLSFILYPNPSSNTINITGRNMEEGLYKIRIIDLRGAIVDETTFNKKEDINSKKVDVSGIANGQYIVQLSKGSTKFSKVITIKH